MLVIFNSAFLNEEFVVIDNRKKITETYLKGWFTVDIVSSIPFGLFNQNSDDDSHHLAKWASFEKVYKLVKLVKLLRILKIVKDQNKIFKYMDQFLNIRAAM